MADFKFAVLSQNPERLNVISSKLGTGTIKYTDLDKKKAVKLGAFGNHVLCVAGDEIDGFIDSVDAATAGGYTFGGVARGTRGFRVEAEVGSGHGSTAMVVGDYVVADAQLAVGTKGLPKVKKGTPIVNRYRVMTVIGDGLAGSTVVLELM